MAVRALVVGAEAGEEDSDVGLVGALFEPGEEALQAIPTVRPFAAGLAVVGLALEHEALVIRGELGEGDVDGDAGLFGEAQEVLLRFAVGLTLKGLHRAVSYRKRAVGDGKVRIDFNDTTETSAARAGAEGGVEGEKRGRGGAKGAAGLRGVEPARVMAGGDESGPGGGGSEKVELALAEVQGLLGGLKEADARLGVERDAILRDEKVVGGGERRRLC